MSDTKTSIARANIRVFGRLIYEGLNASGIHVLTLVLKKSRSDG